MYCSSPWKNPTYLCGSANYPVSLGAVEGRELKYAILRAYLSAWYSVSRRGMFISKGSYGYGECRNVLLWSVENPHLPVWVCKLSRFIGGSRGSRIEICDTSGLPIGMVQRFQKRNVHIKRKLRAWRVQKCIALVCRKTPTTCVGLQTIPHFMGGSIGPRMEICVNSDLHIGMVPHFHKRNVYIKSKLRV